MALTHGCQTERIEVKVYLQMSYEQFLSNCFYWFYNKTGLQSLRDEPFLRMPYFFKHFRHIHAYEGNFNNYVLSKFLLFSTITFYYLIFFN